MASKKTKATCAKDMLTVGFPTASPPLVWRFDLQRNHSFALSLQGEEGDAELGVTSPKGEFYPVARFASREDAEDALEVVEKALSRKKGASLLTIILALVGALAILIVIGVFIYGSAVSSQKAAMTQSSGLGAPSSMPATPSPDTEGVPLSADDVLKPPR